jgi:hypothetical protein
MVPVKRNYLIKDINEKWILIINENNITLQPLSGIDLA